VFYLKKIYRYLKFAISKKRGLFYPKFQDEFYSFQQGYLRGNYKIINERQKIYIPYLLSLPKKIVSQLYFLDAGFGRGEFLDILKKSGIKKIVGVDTNNKSVNQAKKMGTYAINKDVNKYLYLTDKKFVGISAFHLIEHMSFKYFFDFLILSRDKLTDGGILIMETPNVENIIVGNTTFYYDHTHILKLPKLMIETVLKFVGFRKIKFIYLHPAKEKFDSKYDELLYGPQDLAIIAYK